MYELQGNLLERLKADSKLKLAIALVANADQGKTSILKILANLIREYGGNIVRAEAMRNDTDELWCLEYDGVTIGIATGGDTKYMIDEAFEFFGDNSCRLVICATRFYSNSPSWCRFKTLCKKNHFTFERTCVDRYNQTTLMTMHRDIAENILFRSLTKCVH